MPFYQNPFISEFQGYWVLGDRQHIPTFKIPHNAGRGDERVMVFNEGPYDLSGVDADGNSHDTLNIEFALHNNFKHISSLAITITATDMTAVRPDEIASSLNADSVFSGFFSAEVINRFDAEGNSLRLSIQQQKPENQLRFYIKNGQAEEVLKFNKKIGVGEIPSYFARHTIENRDNYDDAQNMLIELDVAGSAVDAAIVDEAVDHLGESLGLDSSTVRDDYEMLEGRSGLFTFKKQTIVGTDLTEVIEYHAGAKAGDLAKKTVYAGHVSGIPAEITEVPYTLLPGDIISP
jgi:hypothetical protein